MNPPTASTRPATDDMKALMEDLKAALAKNPNVPAIHMLSVVSQLVGNLVALQDQRRYTVDGLMVLVANNIQIGNRTAIDSLFDGAGDTPN